MAKKTKKTTASSTTTQVQWDKQAQELDEAKQTIGEQNKEITSLKRQLTEANRFIESDLKSDLKSRIRKKSNFNDADLEDKSVEQLQQIDTTLSMGKLAPSAAATFKSIRAGAASAGKGTLTVGSLFGKSRKEILESEGEF